MTPNRDTSALRFALGKEAKAYNGNNTDIQLNKISEETLMCAAGEFLKYLESEEIAWDIDDFSGASHTVFTKQEADYFAGKGFQVFSMLTLAFLQMWIIELE